MDKLSKEDIEILNEIKKRSVQELIEGTDKFGTPFLKHVLRLYQFLFNEVCSSCSAQIPNYIQRLQNYNVQNSKIMKTDTRKFRMKSGKMIIIQGTNKSYSDHNITDKKAIELLRENPNRKIMFSKLPDNWEELIKEVETLPNDPNDPKDPKDPQTPEKPKNKKNKPPKKTDKPKE